MKIIIIRKEKPKDIKAIQLLNNKAFEMPEEGKIVDVLREKCDNIQSLVAVIDGEIVGHIFFSPAEINIGDKIIYGMGLAPMAVLPEFQNQGIGSELVKAGLNLMKSKECPYVIVLGHPKFYPRFGFEKASKYSIKSQWDVPDESFMILIMDKETMNNVSGTARYLPEFDIAV